MRSIFLLTVVAVLTACGPNQQILRSAETPTPSANTTPPLSGLEQEVKAMRTADFNFIYVFRRKDGAAFDAADKKAASDNIPPEINRRKVIEDGKAVIIGSNYILPPDNFKVLSARFAIEDFSKPASEMTNTNTSKGSQ